mgnify:FL=1
MNGGLNLIATLLGLPGKMEIAGHMVQNLYDEGNLAEINSYCRCDVLDTYLVFLRSMVVTGRLKLEQERKLFSQTRKWLEARLDEQPIYRVYLDRWQPWENPWDEQMKLSV